MRVVGYVRESADPEQGPSAFAQQEQIRRYAAEHGHALVATCQEVRTPGEALGRDGYLSLLGVIASGGVDGVLLPGVATLSSDQIVQEIMLWDLRARDVKVISTDPADIALLDASELPGPSRMLIRDVLERVGEHARSLGGQQIEPPPPLPEGEVMVHLLRPDA